MTEQTNLPLTPRKPGDQKNPTQTPLKTVEKRSSSRTSSRSSTILEKVSSLQTPDITVAKSSPARSPSKQPVGNSSSAQTLKAPQTSTNKARVSLVEQDSDADGNRKSILPPPSLRKAAPRGSLVDNGDSDSDDAPKKPSSAAAAGTAKSGSLSRPAAAASFGSLSAASSMSPPSIVIARTATEKPSPGDTAEQETGSKIRRSSSTAPSNSIGSASPRDATDRKSNLGRPQFTASDASAAPRASSASSRLSVAGGNKPDLGSRKSAGPRKSLAFNLPGGQGPSPRKSMFGGGRKSLFGGGANAASRDPEESERIIQLYVDRLQSAEAASDGSTKSRMSKAPPVFPKDVSFIPEEMVPLMSKIFDMMLGTQPGVKSGCKPLLEKIQPKTVQGVKELLMEERTMGLLFNAVVLESNTAGSSDPARAFSILLVNNVWDEIKAGEGFGGRDEASGKKKGLHISKKGNGNSTTSFDRRFDVIKELASDCDWVKDITKIIDDLVESKVATLAEEREMAMEPDMVEMPRDSVKVMLCLNTMQYMIDGDTTTDNLTSENLLEVMPVPTDPSIVTVRMILASKATGDPRKTVQYRFIGERVGKTTVFDPSNNKYIEVDVVSESQRAAELEAQREFALTEAKKSAKWWGKSNRASELRAQSADVPSRWTKRQTRESSTQPDVNKDAVKAFNKRKAKGRPDGAGPKNTTPPQSSKGFFKKPLERRHSVEAKDLFDIMAPLLFRPQSQEIPGSHEEWSWEAMDYAFTSGRSPDRWNAPKTPLRVAVQTGKVDLVEKLLHAKADPDETSGRSSVALLHLASWNGDIPVVRSLLENQADPDVADRDGQTPYFFAADGKVCQILMEYGGDLEAKNVRGQTALHLLCRGAMKDAIEWFAFRSDNELKVHRDNFGAPASFYGKQAGLEVSFLSKNGLRASRH